MREKKILINYILYFLALIVVCIVGISRPLAATIKTIYPSNNFSQNANNYLKLNESGTFGITNTNLTIQGQSYGFNFYMQENVVLNKTYTIVITFMADDLRSDFQNNYVHVNVGSGSTSSSVAIVSITRNNPTGYSTTLTIKFNPLTTGDYIQVNIISDGPPYSVLTGVSTYGIKNVSLDSSQDTQDIINNQNQNTQDIINAQQSSSSLIINSQQSSASSIMENQNQNTQDLIDSQYTCKIQTITNYNGSKNVALNSSGTIVNADNFNVTNYIKLKNNATYTLTKENWGASRAYCLYNNNKEIISCYTYGTSTSFTINNADYIRYTWSNTNNRTVNLYGDICLKDSEQQTNAINDLNNNVTSDNIDDNGIANAFEDFNDYLDDNSTITQLITLPITLYTAILNNLNGTCSPFNLGELYGEDLILPCINISQYLGNSLWSMIDIIISGFAVYAISKKMIKVFNNFSSLREGDVIDD